MFSYFYEENLIITPYISVEYVLSILSLKSRTVRKNTIFIKAGRFMTSDVYLKRGIEKYIYQCIGMSIGTIL